MKQGASVLSHGHCDAQPCVECLARRYLTPEDWGVVTFYGKVQDQTINLTPNGDAEGQYHFSPRLEAWLAVCELHNIPKDERPDLVSAARQLFEGMHGRSHESGLFRKQPEEMIAQPVETLGDVIHVG